MESGDLARTFTAPGNEAAYGVTFGPEGDVLVAAYADGQVHLWDVVSGGLAATFADPGSQGVNGVAFGPDGDVLAAADGNGCTYLWQTSALAT